jgi:hypothetical protein
MTSSNPQMSKQDTTSKRKHETSNIPQKLDKIRGLESGESRSEVMASHRFGSQTTSDVEKKDHVQFYMASHGSVIHARL